MRVFGCAWKINFPEIIFQLTMCFNGFDRKLVSVKIFTSNHFRTHAQRERERERAQSSDRALVWRPQQRTPQAELDDHRPSSSLTYQIALVSSMAAPRQSSKDRLQRRSISPLSHNLAFVFAAQSCL